LENKIADLSKRLQSVEKERNDGEAEWSRKLEEKTKELDRLKQIAQSSDKMRADKDEAIAAARRESDQLRDEIRAQQERIATLIHEAEKVTEVEVST
jgi:FtsZ-binding cell division protein ZapB